MRWYINIVAPNDDKVQHGWYNCRTFDTLTEARKIARCSSFFGYGTLKPYRVYFSHSSGDMISFKDFSL